MIVNNTEVQELQIKIERRVKIGHELQSKIEFQGGEEQSTSSDGHNYSTQTGAACNRQTCQTVMASSQRNFFSSGNYGDGGDGGGDDEKRPYQRKIPLSKVEEEEKEEKGREESEDEVISMDIDSSSRESSKVTDELGIFSSCALGELEPSDCSMPSAESPEISYIYDSGRIVLHNRQFNVRTILGNGAFGVCALVMDYNSEVLLAMKQIRKDNFEKSEADILTKLQGSPCVIKLHGFQELGNCVRIFMDYAQGGDLHGYLQSHFGQLNGEVKFMFFQGIMEGVRFIHSNRIVHADIKCMVEYDSQGLFNVLTGLAIAPPVPS